MAISPFWREAIMEYRPETGDYKILYPNGTEMIVPRDELRTSRLDVCSRSYGIRSAQTKTQLVRNRNERWDRRMLRMQQKWAARKQRQVYDVVKWLVPLWGLPFLAVVTAKLYAWMVAVILG